MSAVLWLASPDSGFVTGQTVVVDAAGPLKEGEADRAAEWGRALAKVVEHRLLVR